MELIIDGKTQEVLPPLPAEAMEALATIGGSLLEHGRAIVAIRVDGRAILPNRLEETLRGRTLASFATVAVDSQEVRGMVDSALEEIQDVVPSLPQICRDLAMVFQGENPSEGFEPFRKLADVWSAVKSRELQIIGALKLDAENLACDGVQIGKMHEELNGFLNEAAKALELNDLILLGDLLEYELAPRAEAESRIVALLRSQAADSYP